MGRKLNLGHLSEDECEKILKVIQKDFDLRQKEKERLGQIEEEVQEESTKTKILGKQREFNENCCMRCFSRFFFIFNAKVQCVECKYFVCKNCSDYIKEDKEYVCKVCQKQRELQTQSCQWFYDNIKKKYKRFGSAKVVRSLHKRKTDSDSENDSGYDPPYSHSLPIGKHPRAGLQGLFEFNMDNNQSKPVEKELLPENINGDDAENDNVVEDKIVPLEKRVDTMYQSPYSCPVATGQETYDQVRQAEVDRFGKQLDAIVQDIRNNLDTKISEAGAIENGTTGADNLEDYKLQLGSALSNLAQSLHIAVDNQNPDSVTSSSSKHQLVQKTVVDEAERFVGHTVELNEKMEASGGSPDDNAQNQPSYEDLLADAILTKVLNDHRQAEEQQMQAEEDDVRHSLTKLSNRATISQLTDMISESETDEPQSSAQVSSHMDETVSDVESRVSEVSENVVVAKDTRNSEQLQRVKPEGDADKESGIGSGSDPLLHSDTEQQKDTKDSVDGAQTAAKSGTTNAGMDTDSDLDDLVKSNMIESEWKKVESSPGPDDIDQEAQWMLIEAKKSSVPMSSASSEALSPRSLSDEDGMTHSTPNDELRHLKRHRVREIPVSRSMREQLSTSGDSDNTLGASPVDEPFISRRGLFRDNALPLIQVEREDGPPGFEFAQQHRPPLPSFGYTGSDYGEDLDDISHHASELEEEEPTTTLRSEIMFGTNWNFSGSNNLFRNISAYDNSGEKKVGKDGEGPTFMFVPKIGAGPRVGESEVEELSDLSDVSEKSDLPSDEESDSFDEDDEDPAALYDDYGRLMRRGRRSTSKTPPKMVSDSCVQTDDLDLQSPIPMSVGVGSEVTTSEMTSTTASTTDVTSPLPDEEIDIDPDKVQQKVQEKIAMDLTADEDSEDNDPRFLQRPPKVVTVSEGESIKIECEVTGSPPVDVFWYKAGAAITQLEDDHKYEISSREGRFSLEMFNTSKDNVGAYLCIGVNDLGRCSHNFKLAVKDNAVQKRQPEILKELMNIECKERDSIQFRCKVSGYPHPRVLWYKDGKRLRNSQLCKIEKYGNRDYVLSLDYVTLDDDAAYSIVARNIAGEACSIGQLLVEPSPLGEKERQEEAEAAAEEAARQRAPLERQSTDALYPDTQDLLQLAENVSTTRGQVNETAEDMLQSANQLSSLHSQLDEMDKRLDNMQSEVQHGGVPLRSLRQRKQLGSGSGDTELMDRDSMLREHDEMNQTATSIRQVTGAALNLLNTADQVVQKEQGSKRKSPPSVQLQETSSDEEVELQLSFDQFDRLYTAGLVTHDQLRRGHVKRKDLRKVQDFIDKENGVVREQNDVSHDLTADGLPASIDCGLKRVDSKRYKRDYVVVRDSPKVQRKKWEVTTPSARGTQIVRSDSKPLHEHEEEEYLAQTETSSEHFSFDDSTSSGKHHTGSTEEEIYMTAGKVFSLEDRIKQLESQVSKAEEDTSPEQMAQLEDEVARAVAQVTQSEAQVTKVEEQVYQREPLSPGSQQRNPEPDWLHDRRSSIGDWTPERQSSTPTSPRSSSVTSPTPMSPTSRTRVESMELKGDSREDSVPASRVESDVELPSVRNLRSKFNKEVSSADVRRVHSLTGRDLPKTVRENLRKNNPQIRNPNVRSATETHPVDAHLVPIVFEDQEPSSETPTKVTPEKVQVSHTQNTAPSLKTPSRSPTTSPPWKSSNVLTSTPTKTSRDSRGDLSTSRQEDSEPINRQVTTPTEQPIRSYGTSLSRNSSTASDRSSFSEAGASSDSSSRPTVRAQPPKRNRNSAIMARAAFWDQRITEGEVSDKGASREFPDLSADNFKSADEV